MTTMKHTPGPWDVEINGISTHIFQQGKRGNVVASTVIPVWAAVDPEDTHGERARVHANTRLIAAAPELLEALEDILLCLDLDAKAMVAAGRTPPKWYGCSIARAAIAKARGEV